MALSETLSETSICNMSLAKLGANKIPDGQTVEGSATLEAVQCRLHYEQTRDALVRSHSWRFAAARKALSTTTTPAFEWDYAFDLPDDFLAMRSIYENRFSGENFRSYALEGSLLLTDENAMSIRYTKNVTDVTEFDSLFIEVLVLQLALKLTSLAGSTPEIRESLKDDLKNLMPSVKALDRQETNTAGQYELETWNDARYA
ncbi:hypothetical protein LCGC14_1183830 [marine sediment metagenome]|uniref:Tail tubular protein A n=1 Tax=marine sediment metagenome TaxID=412755 RepID=A0A0F9PRU4_9ZZZZ